MNKEKIINLANLLIWIWIACVFLFNLLFNLSLKIIWLIAMVLIFISLILQMRRIIIERSFK